MGWLRKNIRDKEKGKDGEREKDEGGTRRQQDKKRKVRRR